MSATPDTNFTVVRVKRDILRRSTIGAMFTNRSVSACCGTGSNQAYGVDAAFSFYQNVTIGAYCARTEHAGAARKTTTATRRSSTTPPTATARAPST